MVEGRPTWLKPSELAELGFSQVVYPNCDAADYAGG